MTGDGTSTGRRSYLRRTALVAVAGLAGCASLGGGTPTDRAASSPSDGGATADLTGTATASPTDTDTETPSASTSTPSPTPEISAAVSGDYPSYRHDAGRRAFTPGTAGPTTVPEIAYTLDRPGGVYQPVVDGHRLYLAGHRRESNAATLAAFDLRRGAREWDLDLGSRAGAAPTVVGDRLVVQVAGGTYALALDGTVAWSSATVASTGFAPAAVGERVYAVGERGMAAYDAGGREAWSIPLTNRPLATIAADDATVYLVVPRDQLTTDVLALDAADGTTAWRTAVEAQAGFPPVRAGDAVYVTSDRRQGGVTALATADGERLWTADVGLDRGPAVTEDRVVVAQGSRVFARSRANGSADWATDLAAEVVTDPVADSETVYVGVRTDSGGAVQALDASDGGIRWTLPLDRPVGHLVILKGGLVVATRDEQAGIDGLHVVVG